jgi:hypothetical protein
MEKQLVEMRTELNDILKNGYNGAELRLYRRFLKSYLSFKRLESNLIELKSSLEIYKNETDHLKNESFILQDKYNKLKELELSIHKNQLKLEELWKLNNQTLNSKFQIALNQYRSFADSLLESVRYFNSSQTGYNFNDLSMNSTISSNSSNRQYPTINLQKSFDQFKLKYQNQLFLKLSNDSRNNILPCKEIKNMMETLSIETKFKASNCLFIGLLEKYNQLIKEKQLINSMRENMRKFNMSLSLSSELKKSIFNSKKIDKAYYDLFFDLIKNRHNECLLRKSNFIAVKFILI